MTVSNRLFDEIAVGDCASSRRVCTDNDLFIFAQASGNLNPLSLPDRDGDGDPSTPPLAPSMWVGALVSNVIGNRLPGPGSLYRAQSFTFHERVVSGDELIVSVRVIEKREPRLLVLETRVAKTNGQLVADGVAEVYAPTKKLVFDHLSSPPVLVQRHQQFERMLEACRGLAALPTAVVWPHDAASLDGTLQAGAKGLILPVLIGERSCIDGIVRALGKSLGSIEIVEVDDPHQAAEKAVELVHKGRVRAIMKGALHSDALLEPIVRSSGGLRTDRRISHVFVMDVPGLEHPLLISDAAINIAPDLDEKKDITQNAIDLARACGITRPRVGILSAIETVNSNIPSTIDAAVLAKMAERGQIEGGIVDGPLAMDNAVSMQAARSKGITSLVAGRAEVLIVPNLEAGNMLAKELTFIAHADAAGLVLGATVPVMLTSRADSAHARLMSCAIALLYDDWRTRRRGRHPAATEGEDARDAGDGASAPARA
jgi:phosphate butyryltransferase